MNKWIGISLGTLFGVSHIGMIGYIATNNKNGLPKLDIPITPYTSYVVEADKEGYRLSYKANDPKTAYITKDIKEKGGFLGLANNTQKVVEEYFMDGQINQGGAVSNHRSWLDSKTQTLEGDINSSKSEACIKAVGSAEGTGRLVGTSVGAAAAPAVSSIPFVGWVAAGWIAMFGGNQGAEIGGNMAEELNKNC